jgi:hypothetical protein
VLDDEEREKEPPVGEQTPQVLLWLSPDNTEYTGNNQITIPASYTGTWKMAVSMPNDALISVDLVVSEVVI